MPVLLTGRIARALRPTHSYQTSPATDAERLELTHDEARTMSARLIGQPLWLEHGHTDNDADNKIGELLHGYVEGDDWWVQAVLDEHTRAGRDVLAGMLQVPGARLPEPFLHLSLTHWLHTHTPTEVSVVHTPAREGCAIESLTSITNEDLEALRKKTTHYEASTQPPPHSLRVSASIRSMTSPAPPAPQPQMQGQPPPVPTAEQIINMQQKLNSLKQLAGQPVTPEAQHANILQSMANGTAQGNSFVVYNNPEDAAQAAAERAAAPDPVDPLQQIAGVLGPKFKNVFAGKDIATMKTALGDLASHVAALQAENQRLKSAEQSHNEHMASLLADVLEPYAVSPLDQSSMQRGRQNIAEGNAMSGLGHMLPLLVSASAANRARHTTPKRTHTAAFAPLPTTPAAPTAAAAAQVWQSPDLQELWNQTFNQGIMQTQVELPQGLLDAQFKRSRQ